MQDMELSPEVTLKHQSFFFLVWKETFGVVNPTAVGVEESFK